MLDSVFPITCWNRVSQHSHKSDTGSRQPQTSEAWRVSFLSAHLHAPTGWPEHTSVSCSRPSVAKWPWSGQLVSWPRVKNRHRKPWTLSQNFFSQGTHTTSSHISGEQVSCGLSELCVRGCTNFPQEAAGDIWTNPITYGSLKSPNVGAPQSTNGYHVLKLYIKDCDFYKRLHHTEKYGHRYLLIQGWRLLFAKLTSVPFNRNRISQTQLNISSLSPDMLFLSGNNLLLSGWRVRAVSFYIFAAKVLYIWNVVKSDLYHFHAHSTLDIFICVRIALPCINLRDFINSAAVHYSE